MNDPNKKPHKHKLINNPTTERHGIINETYNQDTLKKLNEIPTSNIKTFSKSGGSLSSIIKTTIEPNTVSLEDFMNPNDD